MPKHIPKDNLRPGTRLDSLIEHLLLWYSMLGIAFFANEVFRTIQLIARKIWKQ